MATGSLTKRLGIEDGTVLKEPLIEYCLKDDKLGDPLISEDHIYAFDWANRKEIEKIKKTIFRINDFMIGMFRGVGIKLIDFKLDDDNISEKNSDDYALLLQLFIGRGEFFFCHWYAIDEQTINDRLSVTSGEKFFITMATQVDGPKIYVDKLSKYMKKLK